MTDYSKMSDVEISLAVGKLVSRDGISVVGHSGKAFIHYYSEPTEKIGEFCLGWKEFDPCNSWADVGPIAEKNGISIVRYGHGMWMASHDAYWVDGVEWQIDGVDCQNPCRAICIVFLMMNEGGVMLPTKEQIMAVLNKEWQGSKLSFGDKYPCTLATWNIRARLERLDGNPQFTCADIRKTLAELVKEGVISKHWTSRRGNAVWAYKGE